MTSIPYTIKLPRALIPKKLQEVISEGSTTEIIEKLRRGFLPGTLDSRSHTRFFKTLLWVDEQRAEYVVWFYPSFSYL